MTTIWLLVKLDNVPNGGHDIPFVQGDNNPTKRYTVSRIVNFDSHYRTILDPSSVACPVADPNSNQRLDTPTNYTANLSQPLQNVIEITLENAEIPGSWYVFNSEYGTNYYVLTNKPTLLLFLVVIIPHLLFLYKN